MGGTILIGAILAAIIIWAGIKSFRSFKSNRCLGCGGCDTVADKNNSS